MNLQDLKILRDVALRLSFSQVAEERGIAPSSVSRSIGNLEAELGVKLFQRSTRRMVITEAGFRFCDRLDDLLADFEGAVDEARGIQGAPKGLLRLTASVAFGEAVLMPLIVSFRESIPGIEVEVLLTDARVDLLAEGVDLAIRLGSAPKGEGVCVKLMDTSYALVAHPAVLERKGWPEVPADLVMRDDLVSLTLPGFRDAWMFRAFGREEELVPITASFQVSSPAGLRAAVLAGAGIGLLADWQIADDLVRGQLVQVLGKFEVTATTFETAAYALYPDRRHLPAKVRVFLDFLKTNLA